MKLLLVEDKSGMRDMLTRVLVRENYSVTATEDGDSAIDALRDQPFDLVLTDLQLPGQDGFAVLKAAKEINPDLPVVIMTAYGSIEGAVAAMRDGAYDFITKPFDPDHLLLVLNKTTETRRLRAENRVLRETARHQGIPDIIGGPAVHKVMDQVRQVAKGDTTVLLSGESGTGKELFAQLLHAESPRAQGPFIAVNCAAIPDQLLESEFFGHEKGAFTGAESRRLGKFELARGGTIFLDEIGDMDLTLQSKLLRVLQDGELYRVGGEQPIPLDVRVVAATNQDLSRRIGEGRFREDLFYRLSAFPVAIPPLRERPEDIPELARHFMRHFAGELNRPVTAISDAAMAALCSYQWPGNVRELQNCVERAVILAGGAEISDVEPGSAGHTRPAANAAPGDAVPGDAAMISLDGALADVAARALKYYEGARIRAALDQAGGNKSQAARELAVSYKTLLSKIKEYGIEPV